MLIIMRYFLVFANCFIKTLQSTNLAIADCEMVSNSFPCKNKIVSDISDKAKELSPDAETINVFITGIQEVNEEDFNSYISNK
jgi:hypothetical protein